MAGVEPKPPAEVFTTHDLPDVSVEQDKKKRKKRKRRVRSKR